MKNFFFPALIAVVTMSSSMSFASADETPAVGTCSSAGGWTCDSGTCVRVDSSSGQCCPDDYPNYSRVGFCKN